MGHLSKENANPRLLHGGDAFCDLAPPPPRRENSSTKQQKNKRRSERTRDREHTNIKRFESSDPPGGREWNCALTGPAAAAAAGCMSIPLIRPAFMIAWTSRLELDMGREAACPAASYTQTAAVVEISQREQKTKRSQNLRADGEATRANVVKREQANSEAQRQGGKRGDGERT